MMTTSKAFGIQQRITDPLQGTQIENSSPIEHKKQEKSVFEDKQKTEMLRKAVEKYLSGIISQEELNTIYKVTE